MWLSLNTLNKLVKVAASGLLLSVMFSVGLALADNSPHVELKTNMGNIVLELYPDKAPKTVENFLQYVKSGHYNGTIFHRVIDGFMIQGGGMGKNMVEKVTRAPVINEAKESYAAGLKNEPGTVAMARTSEVNSATAQFFINVADNTFLNHAGPANYGYAVFGKVVEGMDVVDKIRKVETSDSDLYQNVPKQAVVIEKAVVLKNFVPASVSPPTQSSQPQK